MGIYCRTTLENGLRIVTESMPSVRSIAIGFLVDAGPADEPENKFGLAHLVEHTMFNGTSSRNASQIARFMDEAGGSLGAFTTRDYTCYTATVLDDYRTYALDLMGDILLNSTFPEDKLEREKTAIINEIETSFDVPSKRAHALLKEFIWPDHPLGRSIAGRPESVRELTREDIIYFVHENYLPNRMIISAVGHLDHDDFVAQVRDAFWRLIGQSLPAEMNKPVFRSGVVVSHLPVSQVYFSIGVRAYPYSHHDRYTLHVINKILGGGLSSRLFHRLREERGLVYDIGSEYHAYKNDGIIVVEGSTSPEYFQQVIALTLVELWKLFTNSEPVNEEELWKAKMQIRSQHFISGEDTNTRMGRLTTQELYFRKFIPDSEVLYQIDAVDLQRIEEVCQNLCTNSMEELSLAVVGPDKPEYYSHHSIEELICGFHK